MSTSVPRLLRLLCLGLALHLAQGWEAGIEYVYEYDGQVANGLRDSAQSAGVRLRARLTVQSIDDNTLAIKLSEIRIKRHGSAAGDAIWPAIESGDAGGEEEPVGDALHLLSPFVLVHNKGSFVNLMVESDEPAWSVNVKKAAASALQLDVTGVRSGADGGVFGERSSTLNSLEDGLTGDCLTTLRFTRLPYHRVIRPRPGDGDQVLADLCRSTNVYEIVKIKDFDDCRIDPLEAGATPAALRSAPQFKRSAAYKYLACGESAERATIVQIDGAALVAAPGPLGAASRQSVRAALAGRGQIHQLLPNVTRPKVLDTLVYSTPQPDAGASSERVKEAAHIVGGVLEDVAARLKESVTSDADLVERLSGVSATLARLDAAQLRQIWPASIHSSGARDLFLDCAAASGSHSAANFLLELIESGQVAHLRAVSLLASAGHSIQLPGTGLLQRFVRVARCGLASTSTAFKATALAVAAELLHANCIASRLTCRPDAQVVTEDFLPLVVNELENAGSSSERLAILSALGALGSDDVLLLLVPYIRGDDVSARIAAIRSLRRLMDSYPEKVVPLLSSLADNVAERPEVRMAAADVLLFHPDTPLKVWRKIAQRTWFEPVEQVNGYVCSVVRSLASARSSPLASASDKARQVVHLLRPVPGKSGLHFYSSFEGDDHGFFSKIASWRVSNSHLPAFIDHELFYQLGSVGFNPLQLSIWNYDMDAFWNKVLGRAAPGSRGARLNEIWDQLSLRYRPEDDRVGLVHVKLMGSALQGFFNLEHIDRALAGPGDVRLVKYQQLVDLHASVPTELGLPARFRLSMAALVSAQGSVAEGAADVASLASLKWTGEVRVSLPFSERYASAGLDLRAEVRPPRHVTLNGSLSWRLPERETDLAYFHVVPYTLTRSASEDLVPPIEAGQVRVISAGPAANFTLPLAENLRFEVSSGMASDCTASAWLRRFAEADLGAFGLGRLDRRAYRVRYLPVAPLHSVALSGSLETLRSEQDAVDLISGSNDTLGRAGATAESGSDVHRIASRVTTCYSNGSTAEWTPLELEIERRGDVRVTITGASGDLITDYLRSFDSGFLSGIYPSRVSLRFANNNTADVYRPFNTHSKQHDSSLHLSMYGRSSCQITADGVTTYDGVAYDYQLNECHHILTADCGRGAVRYAISGRNDPVHGMAVRVTLENDVIDLSEQGNVSFNGAAVDSNATTMRIRAGDNVLADLARSDDEGVHFTLLHEDVHVAINGSRITIHAGGQLLGRACGLCGDGDGEAAGEYKTPDRCALSSGSLMASTFQISYGSDECPILSDNAFQHLQRESYPCYSVDEQVPSILPLPPES